MIGRGQEEQEEQSIPSEIGQEEGVLLLQLVFAGEVVALIQDADQNPLRQEAIREVVVVVAAEGEV